MCIYEIMNDKYLTQKQQNKENRWVNYKNNWIMFLYQNTHSEANV